MTTAHTVMPADRVRELADRRARRMFAGVAVVLGVTVIAAASMVLQLTAGERSAGAGREQGGQAQPAAPPPPAPVLRQQVTYELGGGESAGNITFLGDDSAVTQESRAVLPWSAHVQVEDSGERDSGYLSLSAQNLGGGSLVCRILVDGVEVARNETSAAHDVVTCSR